ncbi:MAG: 4-hydroxy-tetrahydrodipicolinate reductase [Prevotellaceae bacterium]|jgi:4-hydroxy-tetrahydrodipicolinate reductase|nr:4-hydroxy-tetrahydrodipicolinate reductase [Prevotellaceae bacterium]
MNIALIGYGKMGQTIERIARRRGHEIVSVIDLHNMEDFNSSTFRSADVAIEFTNPQSAYGNCLRTFEADVKLVSGSTGWMQQHGDEIHRLCHDEGKTLFWSSNFSLGVALFSAVNTYLARLMNDFPSYDVSMTEVHHIHKLDAPSGTAITLAESIVHELSRKTEWVKQENYTSDTQLPITSLREGETPGIHTIRYESEADSIVLTHDAKNRDGFALGAVLAAEYTATHTGLLGMNDLFPFLNNQ